jgi:putative ABC transport system permease protein
MMTEQILTGIDPFISARYQIMVMTMLLSAGGFSAFLFLLIGKSLTVTGAENDQP